MPRLLAGSLVASILAIIAAGVVLLTGGAAPAGPVAISAPSPSRAASPVPSATLRPSPSGSLSPSLVASSSPSLIAPTPVPIPRDAQTAGTILIQAWLDRDEAKARLVAPGDVVSRLFARTPTGTPKLQQCDNVGTGQWDCLFTGAEPNVDVRVVQDGDTFRVDAIDFY